MRITIDLDDALFETAEDLTGLQSREALLSEALKALIGRESAKRLARLGGTKKVLRVLPRRCGKPS